MRTYAQSFSKSGGRSCGSKDELYRKLRPQIIRYGAYMLGNVEAGEDICQEVFMAYNQNKDAYQEKSAIETYLFGITKNICRNWIRKKRREKNKQEAYQSHTFLEQSSKQVKQSELEEKKRLLNQALSHLSAKFREPLLLYTMENLSYLEIAKLLKISEGTVKSRIHSAKEKLMKVLNQGSVS